MSRPPSESAAQNEPKVKGVAFRSVLAVAVELHGEAKVEQAMASLAPEDAEALRYRVVHTGWYPISLYRKLWSALLTTLGGGYETARTIGAGALRRDVTGVYRMLFKVLSPETVLSLSGRFFNNYYDTGTLHIRDQKHGSARAVYEGCVGFDKAMWEELVGSSLEMIRIGGGKNVRATIERGGESATCTMLVEWE